MGTQLAAVMQRTAEKMLQAKMKAQMEHGKALGWPAQDVVRLRNVFEELDANHKREVPLSDIAKGVTKMDWSIAASHLKRCLLQMVYSNDNGTVSFEDFLTLMFRVDGEIRKTDAEMLRQMRHGTALGWPAQEIVRLRHVFEELTENNYESYEREMHISDVAKAVTMMEWGIGASRLECLLADAASNGRGLINFEDFMTLMFQFDEVVRMDEIEAPAERMKRQEERETMVVWETHKQSMHRKTLKTKLRQSVFRRAARI